MTAVAPDLPRPHPLWRLLVAGAVASGLALAALLAAEARWLAAGLMLGAALAAALAPVLRLPGALIALIAAASVVNGASIAWDWYTSWPAFDEYAHLLNPVMLVAPSMIWLHRAGFVPARPGGALFVAAASVYGLVLAAGWEVIETFLWTYPLADTLTDVGLGVAGSALGGWLAGHLVRPQDLPPHLAPSP
jgi:hypothetical protein